MINEVEAPIDTITEDAPRKQKIKEFVRAPGKTAEDRMPADQRPRVKAAQARYMALRISQGFDS